MEREQKRENRILEIDMSKYEKEERKERTRELNVE
jgi:hypothetical protein